MRPFRFHLWLTAALAAVLPSLALASLDSWSQGWPEEPETKQEIEAPEPVETSSEEAAEESEWGSWGLKTASGDFFEEEPESVGGSWPQSQQPRRENGDSVYDTASDVRNGPNVYTYVTQNPWTFFDSRGLSAKIYRSKREDKEYLLIEIPMVFFDARDPKNIKQMNFNSKYVKRMTSSAEETLSGSFGKYEVKVIITKGDVNNIGPNGDTNAVGLMTDEALSKTEAGRAHVEGPRRNVMRLDESDDEHAFSHETLHTAGGRDHYDEGPPLVTEKGWKGNIMGERNGVVEEKNYDEIVKRAQDDGLLVDVFGYKQKPIAEIYESGEFGNKDVERIQRTRINKEPKESE